MNAVLADKIVQSEIPGHLESAVNDLEALLEGLPPKRQDFAKSLISGPYGYRTRGFLTPKQIPYLYSLLSEAVMGEQRQKFESVTGIVQLLATAKQHLKYPKIVLPYKGNEMKLWIAGNKSKYPGSISLTIGSFWFGRIGVDGTFYPSKSYYQLDNKDELLEFLTNFASDPAKMAGELGKLAGKCVFCNLPIDTPESLAVGYGPVCAKHYGLPWGEKTLTVQDVANA